MASSKSSKAKTLKEVNEKFVEKIDYILRDEKSIRDDLWIRYKNGESVSEDLKKSEHHVIDLTALRLYIIVLKDFIEAVE